MIPASDADEQPAVVRAAMAGLGFQYLTLHTFSARPGSLASAGAGAPRDQELGRSPPRRLSATRCRPRADESPQGGRGGARRMR